jgi:hypothetical protein
MEAIASSETFQYFIFQRPSNSIGCITRKRSRTITEDTDDDDMGTNIKHSTFIIIQDGGGN